MGLVCVGGVLAAPDVPVFKSCKCSDRAGSVNRHLRFTAVFNQIQ